MFTLYFTARDILGIVLATFHRNINSFSSVVIYICQIARWDWKSFSTSVPSAGSIRDSSDYEWRYFLWDDRWCHLYACGRRAPCWSLAAISSWSFSCQGVSSPGHVSVLPWKADTPGQRIHGLRLVLLISVNTTLVSAFPSCKTAPLDTK